MLKFSVFKTVVPYGQKEQYLLIWKAGLGRFLTLKELVEGLRTAMAPLPVAIKNEAPGDVIWKTTADGIPVETLLCQRLSSREMRQLVALLRR